MIPNARRDYFNPTPALKSFEQIVHDFFYSDLYDLYHYASKVRSAQKSLTNFEEKEKEFEEKVKNAGFIDSEEKEIAKKEIEESREKVAKAKRELENRRKDAANNEVLGKVFTEIEKTYKNDGSKETGRPKKDDKSENTEKNNKYLTQSLSKFGKKEQKLIAKIYVIIKSMLPKDMAEMVVADQADE